MSCTFGGLGQMLTVAFFCVFCYIMREFVVKKIFLLIAVAVFVSCATKPAANIETPAHAVERPTDNAATATVPAPTIITTPSKSDIEDRLLDARLIRNVEIGSPDSLRAAVAFIAADTKGLTNINRLYLVLTSEIMKRLYKHEQITWNVPAYSGENKYLTAFAQIDEGRVPQNLDESTFLALVIPCFYAVTDSASNNLESKIDTFESRLTKAQNLVPQSVLPHFLRGVIYEKLGQTYKARNSFKTAFELDASCTQAGLNYARLLAKTGDVLAALQVAKSLGALQNTTEYKLLLAESYIGLKEYDKASEIVIALLTSNPENTDAVLLRIKILIAQQEYLKANALLDAFATRDRTNKEYLLLRSRLVFNWNKSTSSALALLSQAYEKYPNDFDVLLACAKICFETGQTIQGNTAEDFIGKVTAKDAQNVQAANLLVRNAIGNEAWSEAVVQAEKLTVLSNTVENRMLLVQAYLGADKTAKALSVAKALYDETETKNDSITSLYLAVLNKSGRVSDVINIINAKMPTASNTLKAILYFYQSSISSGEVKLSYLRSSLLADPRNTDSLFAMYRYYYESGDYKKAEYYLKQVIAIEPLNKKNSRLLQDLQSKM